MNKSEKKLAGDAIEGAAIGALGAALTGGAIVKGALAGAAASAALDLVLEPEETIESAFALVESLFDW